MVNSAWTYTVTFYDKSAGWASTNITAEADEIPLFTETAEKQVNMGVLMLNAKKGQFIKSGINGQPHIEVYDRIHISVNDGASGAYGRWFDIVKKIPIKGKGIGTKLKLQLEGTERWTQKINYAKPHYFETAYNVLVDIVANYNDNRGTEMPSLTIGTNELPNKGVLHIDFGINEDTTFNRIYDLVDMMASSGSAGGVLDFFDVKFTTTGANALRLDVISSGNTTGGKPSVTINSTNVNMGETDGGLEGKLGTVVNSWGANGAGSLPVEFSKFRSRQEIMPSNNGDDSYFAEWDAGQTPYPQYSIVSYNNQVYISNIANNNSTPPAGWTTLTTETYYGGNVNANTGSGNIEYSPWTRAKAGHFKNSGADPAKAYWPFSGTAKGRCWDINVIINDDDTKCVDADLAQTSSALSINSPEWLYNGNTEYDGLTVLVKGTGIGDFVTHDNEIVEFIDGEWRTKYEPVTDLMCTVYDEGKIYKYDGSSWQDVTVAAGGASWCFHPYDSITNTTNEAMKSVDTGTEYTQNTSSAVTATYSWTPVPSWLESVFVNKLPSIVWSASPEYYQVGGWLNLRFPYPINTYNSVSGGVGNIYGGSSSTEFIPYLDSQNMHLTPNGSRGFNQGSETEALGPLSSLDFMIKIKFGTPGGTAYLQQANFKMRVGLIDLSDHVVYQDFIISHNDNWQSVKLPLSSFQIYRGRRPKFNTGFISDIITPIGIDAVETFEWRHIKGIVIQTQDSYDEFGRYIGAGGKFGLVSDPSKIELSIDALRFSKPLLVNTGIVSDLVIEPDFLQKPEIQNYEQLRYDAQAELERVKFESKIYEIETTGKIDISYGDYFYFYDQEIVDESDSASDTIKLVAKHIEYSITKPTNDSPGGFLRRIRGARRFV